MRTIALRFSDNYAPEEGMIYHHEKLVKQNGFVWYGKFGNKISKEIIMEQLKNEDPKFLLIKSGGTERYWVHFIEYSETKPDSEYIPQYYRENSEDIKCWFKIINFERAEKNILSKCFVISSGDSLSVASKHSMNPYFKINYIDGSVKDGKNKES